MTAPRPGFRPRTCRIHTPAVLAALALLSLGCGGSGGSAVSVEPSLDEGAYTIDEFDPPPEREEGYQPLGTSGFQALSRDELFVVTPTANAEGRIALLQDDAETGHMPQTDLVPLFAGEGLIHAAAFGQIDGDADDEMVVATVDASETRIDLHRVERSPGGGPLQRLYIRSVPAMPWNFEDVRVQLADIDGDFMDEILVTARSEMMGRSSSFGTIWVFDDPAAGATELFEFGRADGHIALQVLPLQLDGDRGKELVVALSGDTTNAGRCAVRLFDFDAELKVFEQIHSWRYLEISTNYQSSKIVAGDFDDDGREDLAYVGTRNVGAQRRVDISLHEFDPIAADWPEYAQTSLIDAGGPAGFGYGDYAATTLRHALLPDQLAIARFGGTEYFFNQLRYDRSGERWDSESLLIDRVAGDQTVSLCASDTDADGREEAQVALASYSGGGRLDMGVVGRNQQTGDLQLAWQPAIGLGGGGSSSRPRLPVLASGDFDADGLAVEFTGNSDLRLADPIPLVLLSAAPTQAGISQNYDNTESAYSSGSSRGESIGVSTYSSITTSVSIGATLFGALGVEGRASFERGVERTNTSTRQESVVRGFRGAYDHDVIIFQGTLYETYEYRIVGAPDPTLVGSLMTVDLPVGSNTYKWTVDYYNQQVDADDRIGVDLRTHTPGDAASYPSRGELDALIGADQHWDMQGGRPVGQGTASDFESVSFETVQATEEERTISRSYGGGASFGVSVSVDATSAEGSTHSAEFGQSTTFEASIGDIAEPSDYTDWNYTWGFAIQTVGRTSTGYTTRKHSFQYFRFWVDPQGAAY